MDISVVVPLLNEAESLPELEAWIRRVMDEHGFSYEIVFVDDGSTDNSWAIIHHPRPCGGQSQREGTAFQEKLWQVAGVERRL